MIYEYRCSLCERIFDIEHPMSEVGNLSEETKAKMKCAGIGKCEYVNEGDEEIIDKIEFSRHYGAFNLLKFDSLSPQDKQAVLKKRASADFKKNLEEKKRVMQGDTIKQLKNIVKPE